jgi:phasin
MFSLEKDDDAVSESDVKAGMNGTNGFGMPLFGFPKIALPGLIGELAAQGVARAQQGCEEIKVAFASDEMREALRETYSSNARSATDYGLKVFEISNANTAAAINFLAHLWGSKSVTDVFSLTAAQTRKALDTATAQNKELWGLAQKLATETGEPIKKHFAKVLHQAS